MRLWRARSQERLAKVRVALPPNSQAAQSCRESNSGPPVCYGWTHGKLRLMARTLCRFSCRDRPLPDQLRRSVKPYIRTYGYQ